MGKLGGWLACGSRGFEIREWGLRLLLKKWDCWYWGWELDSWRSGFGTMSIEVRSFRRVRRWEHDLFVGWRFSSYCVNSILDKPHTRYMWSLNSPLMPLPNHNLFFYQTQWTKVLNSGYQTTLHFCTTYSWMVLLNLCRLYLAPIAPLLWINGDTPNYLTCTSCMLLTSAAMLPSGTVSHWNHISTSGSTTAMCLTVLQGPSYPIYFSCLKADSLLQPYG